jgi:hypothetical protein
MSSRTLRRRVAAAFLLALAPVITACGFSEQTDVSYQSAIGVQSRTGDVWVLNAVVVTAADGKGTFAGSLANQTDQDINLTGITGATGKIDVDVPANGLVNLATDGKVRVSDDSITPGSFVSLTLQFSNGQTTALKVPVYPNTGDYADVPVGSADDTSSSVG